MGTHLSTTNMSLKHDETITLFSFPSVQLAAPYVPCKELFTVHFWFRIHGRALQSIREKAMNCDRVLGLLFQGLCWAYYFKEKKKRRKVAVVQSLSCDRLFVTPWTAAGQVSLTFTISWNLLKLMSIELMMPSNHLILCHTFLFWPSIFPRNRVFSNESALRIRWPKYWSFTINPSNEYSGFISFRIDWFDLFAAQGTSLESSSTTIQKHQFSSSQPSFWSNSHICIRLLEKP